MKKIINGKKYDTETAKEMGDWSNGRGISDFNALAETLYRKKTGEYFLYGWGGACTEYAETVGSMVYDGEAIIPLTLAEAQEWAEDHLDGDKYEEIFGEVEE